MKLGTFAKAVCGFIVSGLLLAAATPAMGDADYCIDAPGISPFVLRAFKIPKAGECSTLIGTHVFSVLSGVACTASNGDHVTFGFTRYSERQRAIYHIDLHLASQNGVGDELLLPPGESFPSFSTSGGECASPVPIL
jgi:hypothetical protein